MREKVLSSSEEAAKVALVARATSARSMSKSGEGKKLEREEKIESRKSERGEERSRR